jgi:chromate transport protein ChrA
MGQYFFRDVEDVGGDLGKLTWQQDWKLRNAVLSILLLAVGYQLFMRGLPTIIKLTTFAATNQAYYLIQMIFFIPLAIVGLFFAFAKRAKKSPKDKSSSNTAESKN